MVQMLLDIKENVLSIKDIEQTKKENKVLGEYLCGFTISGKYITHSKSGITMTFENESEIIGKILLMEYMIRFFEMVEDMKKIGDLTLKNYQKSLKGKDF